MLVYPATDGTLHYTLFDGRNAILTDRTIPGSRLGARNQLGLAEARGSVFCVHTIPDQTECFWTNFYECADWETMSFTIDALGRIGIGVLNTEVYLVFVQPDGALGYRPVEVGTPPPSRIPDAWATGGVAVATFDNQLHCFHRASDPSGRLFRTIFNGTSWSSDVTVGSMELSHAPAVTEYYGKLFCAFQGYWQNHLWYTTIAATGTPEEKQVFLGHDRKTEVRIKGVPALTVMRDVLYCFYQTNEDSRLRYITWSGSDWSTEAKEVDGITIAGDVVGVAAATWRPAWPS